MPRIFIAERRKIPPVRARLGSGGVLALFFGALSRSHSYEIITMQVGECTYVATYVRTYTGDLSRGRDIEFRRARER